LSIARSHSPHRAYALIPKAGKVEDWCFFGDNEQYCRLPFRKAGRDRQENHLTRPILGIENRMLPT
jgi:hypothetical protein